MTESSIVWLTFGRALERASWNDGFGGGSNAVETPFVTGSGRSDASWSVFSSTSNVDSCRKEMEISVSDCFQQDRWINLYLAANGRVQGDTAVWNS
jgi:hypothetical protein